MFKNIHRTLSSLGFLVLIAITVLALRPDWRSTGEWHFYSWLQERRMTLIGSGADLDAADRVTAANPSHLPKEQAELMQWLSKKYRVAPEPMSAIVTHAFEIGRQLHLEPTLILAVIAVESGFNPFAQSSVGAQGLMQVMTRVHTEKYDDFGGKLAAFDPISNLRVGAKVLLECITKAGSVEGGLKYYVGATTANDRGYSNKVLLEQQRLDDLVLGHQKQQVALSPDYEPRL